MNPDLLKYMKKELRKGISREKIEKDLLEGHHTKEEIQEHFSAIDATAANRAKQVSSGVKKLLPVLVILIVGGIIWMSWPEPNPEVIVEPPVMLRPVHEDELLMKTALIEGEKTLCNGISRAELKNDCVETFTAKETCDDVCQQENMLKMALIKNDVTLCYDILDESMRQNCENSFE